MLGKSPGGLYKALAKEKREKERLRGKQNEIKFIDLGFKRRRLLGFREERRREGVPFYIE